MIVAEKMAKFLSEDRSVRLFTDEQGAPAPDSVLPARRAVSRIIYHPPKWESVEIAMRPEGVQQWCLTTTLPKGMRPGIILAVRIAVEYDTKITIVDFAGDVWIDGVELTQWQGVTIAAGIHWMYLQRNAGMGRVSITLNTPLSLVESLDDEDRVVSAPEPIRKDEAKSAKITSPAHKVVEMRPHPDTSTVTPSAEPSTKFEESLASFY